MVRRSRDQTPATRPAEAERARWMAAAQDGDAAAYASLLSSLLPLLRGFVRGRGVDGSEVEDVVQEIVILIHRARHTWRADRPFDPWMWAIARNASTDALRRLARERSRRYRGPERFGIAAPLEAPPDGSGDARSQYAHWLMRAHDDWRVLNRGVNGQRSDEIRARFGRDVVAARPHVVVIIAGVNDVYQGRSAEAVERELEQMYDEARAAKITVVAGTIVPYDTAGADENARMHAVNGWIRGYAAAHPDSVVFCDTRAAVAAPDQPDRLRSSPDSLHPSPEGYRLMADALEPAISAALAKAGALR